MLPRMATQVTVPTPPPEPTTESEPRPAVSAEALANLRAALVLRLLEAMMRQIGQRGDKGNVAHQLLDVLFAAMKTMPPRDGKDNEPAKRLANLLSRLPAEMRPPIERLLTTALSVASTRVLMEIIRNPGGRDAQRLAQALLATTTEMPNVDRAASKLSQRFAGLEAQLAASSRNVGREIPAGAMKPGASDGRALQAALRRMFEAGVEARPSHGRSRIEPGPTMTPTASRMPMQASAVAGTGTQGVPGALQQASIDGARLGVGAAKAPEDRINDGHPLLDTDAENGDRPIGKTAPLGTSREGAANTATVNAPAIEARTTTQESVQRLIAGLIANLTEDEALVLRLLLQAPLPEAPPNSVNESPLPEPAVDDPAADNRGSNAKPGTTDQAGGNEPGAAHATAVGRRQRRRSPRCRARRTARGGERRGVAAEDRARRQARTNGSEYSSAIGSAAGKASHPAGVAGRNWFSRRSPPARAGRSRQREGCAPGGGRGGGDV